jgi:hypothetical protein
MYTSFCDDYERTKKDVQALVQKYMAPYSPAYLPAASSGPMRLSLSQSKEYGKMREALEEFFRTTVGYGVDWDYVFQSSKSFYHNPWDHLMQSSYNSEQIREAQTILLRVLWLTWKGSEEGQAK